jgi:hypothetical protein
MKFLDASQLSAGRTQSLKKLKKKLNDNLVFDRKMK